MIFTKSIYKIKKIKNNCKQNDFAISYFIIFSLFSISHSSIIFKLKKE